jgi:DNA-binding MarR family transcriptional regulator
MPAADVIAKMMIDVALSIDGENPSERRSLDQMMVWFAVMDAATSDTAIDPSGIARRLRMPRSSVTRHLKALVSNGELTPGESRGGNVAFYSVNRDMATDDRFRTASAMVQEAARRLTSQESLHPRSGSVSTEGPVGDAPLRSQEESPHPRLRSAHSEQQIGEALNRVETLLRELKSSG